MAALQRLQLQLKRGGRGGLEGRVAAVQSLLLSPQFGRAISVHNKLQEVRDRPVHTTIASTNSQAILRDVSIILTNKPIIQVDPVYRSIFGKFIILIPSIDKYNLGN